MLTEREYLTNEAHNLIYELQASGWHKKRIYSILANKLGLPKKEHYKAHFHRMVTIQEIRNAYNVLNDMADKRAALLHNQFIASKKTKRNPNSNTSIKRAKQKRYRTEIFTDKSVIMEVAERNRLKCYLAENKPTLRYRFFKILHRLCITH